MAWINIFISYLFGTTLATKTVAKKVFEILRTYVTSKTKNVIDDVVLSLLEAIFTGDYVTTGTGHMEKVIAYLLPKATPWMRYAAWWALDFVYRWGLNNKIDGDEKAYKAALDFVFPDGAPEKPDWPWETIETEATLAAEDVPEPVPVESVASAASPGDMVQHD